MSEDVDAERARLLDEGRPEAVARQHERGRLTARERVDLLCDGGSFLEYGAFARPAHADVDGPADGVITGIGTVAGRAVVVAAFDYTVFGGTMGQVGKVKLDRMIALAGREEHSFVVLAEGGGARAQDLGITSREGTTMFVEMARLSGRVPMVGVVLGPAFAGHANLVAFCDVIVATQDSSLGIGGPPMVEAAMGRRMRPDEIGPIELHARSGVVDLVAADDAAALGLVRRYLGYMGGDEAPGSGPADPGRISALVPDNPRRGYDVRAVVGELIDQDSALELRPSFGRAVVTTLARLGGIAVGVIASQPMHRAGALESGEADKITRFVRLCDAFGLPLLFLVDTPGFMVGPEAEEAALVRHSARVVHALALARVPVLTVIMRKAYGLGYYALGAPPFDPLLVLEWPTAEYGGMGLEGAAQILRPWETDEADTHAERSALASGMRDEHTARVAAARFAVDDLIDPAATRDRLVHALHLLPPARRQGSGRPIDPW